MTVTLAAGQVVSGVTSVRSGQVLRAQLGGRPLGYRRRGVGVHGGDGRLRQPGTRAILVADLAGTIAGHEPVRFHPRGSWKLRPGSGSSEATKTIRVTATVLSGQPLGHHRDDQATE